jgi:hypothetical protein
VSKKLTAAQLALLARAHHATVYVYANTTRPGARVSEATLNALIAAGLIVLGEYQPMKGKPLLLTDAGRALLPTTEEN